jgi:putative oxidoreductase
VNTFHGLTLNLLRIVTGLMFWQHGAQKLFGALGGTAAESWFSWHRGIAGILEFFGGILVILGLFTRPVAFLLSGEMAIAYFWRHAPQGFWPIENGGERTVLFCFIFLFLCVAGGGGFSLDGLLKKRRQKNG